jgi:dihydrofolate synthase/folylpolyglutamate synthase
LDGAHNPHAAGALAATWKQEFPGEKCTLIFGSLQDKDAAGLLKTLAPMVGEVILLQVDSPRAISREGLATLVGEHLSGVPCRMATDAAAALALPAQFRRLATGSLYLVGEVLALLQKRKFEKSAQ